MLRRSNVLAINVIAVFLLAESESYCSLGLLTVGRSILGTQLFNLVGRVLDTLSDWYAVETETDWLLTLRALNLRLRWPLGAVVLGYMIVLGGQCNFRLGALKVGGWSVLVSTVCRSDGVSGA